MEDPLFTDIIEIGGAAGNGEMESLPARMIQATHCLLFHAGRQVLATDSLGVHRFDGQVDAWLLEHAPAALELEMPA